jgi:hypothetical protein
VRSATLICGRLRVGPATGRHLQLIYVDGEPAGLLTLRAEPDGEIEIVSFGLVPDRQGHVSEGPALTLAVDLAWTAFGGEVSRVWLHRNNFDHSSALPNYLKRGFTIVEEVVPSGERSRQLGAVEFSIAVPVLTQSDARRRVGQPERPVLISSPMGR